jgi:hypothetical protein
MVPAMLRRSLLLLLLTGLVLSAAAQPSDFDVKVHYRKLEVQIPMRDGVRLFTAVYVPKDTTHHYPFLVNRTPYAVRPYGPDTMRSSLGPWPQFAAEGYIFVYQDVRGRYLSEGTFNNMTPHIDEKRGPQDVDESTDLYDTVEWLLANVHPNNGRVGIWGISYPGFYASASIIDSHPAIKAASPQAPIADWFVGDDFHHNGAFFLIDAFDFMSSFARPRPRPTTEGHPRIDKGTPDQYDFFLRMGPLSNANALYFRDDLAFWDSMMVHPNYDAFWQRRNILPHLKNIRAAVLTVGGWFDAEDLYGPLQTYAAIERQNPGLDNRLVMGPWIHGGWARTNGDRLGDVTFGSNTTFWYREHVELAFFNHHLKDSPQPDLPEVLAFRTGANDWQRFDAWPPPASQERALYFHPTGRLSFSPPTETNTATAFDEYLSDPNKPVPYLGEVRPNRPVTYMSADQRFAATRPDVLVYESEPLTEDVTLAGPIHAELFVSTTGQDADFIVKLIDVYPNDTPDPDPNPQEVFLGGYQQLVRGEAMRARFRNSFETPAPLTPNVVTPVRFYVPDVLHTFRKGHRIMVQVQSTWFPLVDRNPQTWVPNIYQAQASDFQKAMHRLYRSATSASHLRVHVLEE